MARNWKISKDDLIRYYHEGREITIDNPILKTSEGNYSLFGKMAYGAEKREFYSCLTEKQYRELVAFGNSLKSRKEGS